MRRAFTLLELLVVCSILTLLAALLWPLFVQARHKVYQTQCLSSLRQIGQAASLYLLDYDERFPSCYFQARLPYYVDLNVAVQPYVKGNQILLCPERFTRNSDCLGRCLGYGYNWGSGIGWSTALAKADGLVTVGNDGMAVGVTQAEVVQPVHTFLAGDTNDYRFQTLLRDVMPGVRSPADSRINWHGDPYEPPRHFNGNAFVFCDGHVQWLSFPGGVWTDKGPWVVPDMFMYQR